MRIVHYPHPTSSTSSSLSIIELMHLGCRDTREHDNAKREWSDDDLKKLYDTHEKLLDLVSLYCFVPRSKYLPLGPTR